MSLVKIFKHRNLKSRLHLYDIENLLLLGLVRSMSSSIVQVSFDDPCLKGFNLPKVFDTDEKKVGFFTFFIFEDVDPTLFFSISDMNIFILSSSDLKFSFSLANTTFAFTSSLMLWAQGVFCPLLTCNWS